MVHFVSESRWTTGFTNAPFATFYSRLVFCLPPPPKTRFARAG